MRSFLIATCIIAMFIVASVWAPPSKAQFGSCAGSAQASCAGSAQTRVTIFRRAPVRTFFQNRPARVQTRRAALFGSQNCGG